MLFFSQDWWKNLSKYVTLKTEISSAWNTVLFNFSFQSEVNVFKRANQPPFLKSFLIHLSIQLVVWVLRSTDTLDPSASVKHSHLSHPHLVKVVLERTDLECLSAGIWKGIFLGRRCAFQVVPTYRWVSKQKRNLSIIFKI